MLLIIKMQKKLQNCKEIYNFANKFSKDDYCKQGNT